MRSWLTIEDCLQDLNSLSAGERSIKLVVLHHTWRPDHAQWKGDGSANSVKKFWLKRRQEEGWTHPPGGHFIIAPNGKIYAPFGDISIPLNANSDRKANREGVAIEMVGDFDVGHDVLNGVQRHSAMGLIGGLLVRFNLAPRDLFFHRDFPAAHKSCPGTSLRRDSMRLDAQFAMEWARLQMR